MSEYSFTIAKRGGGIMKTDYFKEAFNKVSEEKRNKILDAAIVEFAEHGFESANINSIASVAGVSVGSMYKYFDHKEDLFLTIIHYGVDTLKTVLGEIVAEKVSLDVRIEKIIGAIQRYSREQVHLTKLYNEMATESRSSLVWKIVSEMENATAGLYTYYIKEAQAKGQVRSDVNPGYFAFFLDNLFIMLQFSYACEYYKDRMKIFIGEDVLEQDDLMTEQLMKFIKGAFFYQ
jgi:TetR/AcrR family transcriptional regulator